MAAVRASHSCFCPFIEPSETGKARHDLGFSSSVSSMKYAKLYAFQNNSWVVVAKRRQSRFVARVSPVESNKPGVNGSKATVKSSKVAINGSKVVAINGTHQVKKDGTSALVKTRKETALEKLPFTEELKVMPSDEGFNWAKDNYNQWQRSVDIWTSVLSLRIRVLFDNARWSYPGGFTAEKQIARRKKTAAWLREQILQLGPTFIKLGQFSSTRSDLFPREFVDELAKLQDRVPAFSPEKAKTFIQNELGAPVDELFKEFEDRPIAAASLGQVHRAILHNGEKVVVKVQRPGLKKLFDIDLRNLKLIAEYFQRSDTFGGPTKNWLSIYEESSGILYEEIDYINEGKNADRFRRDFRNINWVRVPVIFWDYTSSKVLTLEYVPGIKINCLNQIDEKGFSRSQIASRSIESYLIQVLKAGFFHADPHPGNLAIDRDGSLIYYDFGMMGEIKSFTRERLLNLFYAFYEKNPDKVLRCLTELEVLQPTGDLSSVRRSVKFFLDNLLSHSPDREQTLAAAREDLFEIAMDQPIRFPSTFTFFMKAFSTLEGIGYTLDPKFSFVKIAAPYAQELLDSEQKPSGSELVEKISKQANEATNYTVSMPYRIQRIEEIVKQLESGDLKLRVTVLESERAARKATILQMATMNAALGGTLLNIGVTLSGEGNQLIAHGFFVGAGIFLILLIRSMQRVKKIDKHEKMF